MKFKFSLLCVMLLILIGCAADNVKYPPPIFGSDSSDSSIIKDTPSIFGGYYSASGNVKYTPPIFGDNYSTSITVPENKDIVWQRLIRDLSNTGFLVNNIEKDSGLINISYRGDPCEFVTCGSITSVVIDSNGERTHSFHGCEKYVVYEVVKDEQIHYIKRSTRLESRATIAVSEVDGGTLVKVNVQYLVTIDGKIFDAMWNHVNSNNNTIIFNSNETGTTPYQTTCRPLGNFESEILKLASGKN